jgi:hypothetical protein
VGLHLCLCLPYPVTENKMITQDGEEQADQKDEGGYLFQGYLKSLLR